MQQQIPEQHAVLEEQEEQQHQQGHQNQHPGQHKLQEAAPGKQAASEDGAATERLRLEALDVVEEAAKALGMLGPRGRGFPPLSTIQAFNAQSQPQRIPAHNDSGLKEWTNVDARPRFLVGEEALAVPPEAPYELFWPIHGDDLPPTTVRSRTAAMADMEHIWRSAIERHLHVSPAALASFKLLVVLPDTASRTLVKEIVTMALAALGFGFVCVHQASVCASFGAGLAAAVVVDVGHDACRVSCVDDGVSLPASRVSLCYGGADIGRRHPS